MGFRFRKSFGKGPFRINISKSGIGYSVGVKGARITKTAKGTKRTTLSIPGTGLSYVTETSGKRKRNRKSSSPTTPVSVPKSDNNTNTNTKGTSNSVSKSLKKILLFIVAVLAIITLTTKPKTEIDENAPVATTTATATPSPAPTATPAPAVPVGAEGEPFLGTWYGQTMEMEGTTFSLSDFGMTMELTFCEDGTATMYDGEEEETSSWTVTDGAAVVDGITLTLQESGELWIEEDGAKIVFAREGEAPAPTALPTAKPTATPTKVSRTKPTTNPTEKSTATTVAHTATPKPTVAPTEVPTVAPTATAKPTEAPTSTPVPPSNDTASQRWVWVPANGTKYHSNSSCSNMKNPKKVTHDEAIELGYEPCKRCN